MNKFYFTPDERTLMLRVIEKGMLQKHGRDAPQWWVARIALAKSLAMEGVPDGDEFAPPPHVQGSSELHLDQITGRNKPESEDYTGAFKLLLAVRHGVNFFQDDNSFEEKLHRHIRRGLREIRVSWRENFDFFDYLYQDLFYDAKDTGAESAGESSISEESFVGALEKIGVSVEVEQLQEGLRLARFRLILSGVSDYDSLRRNIDDLNFILGLSGNSVSFELGGGERRVVVDVPRPMSTWRYVDWHEVEDGLSEEDFVLPVCPATDVLGQPVVFDLVAAPHLLVGGTTGSGKSICLHAMILSLLVSYEKPDMVLIDAKSVELIPYEKLTNLRGGRVVTDMREAVGVFEELVERMNERQRNYASLGARDIDEARRKGSDDKRFVVVVDELADLVLEVPDVVDPLVRLAQKARAFGIHLVLATQRPEAGIFPGLLRSNIPSRIALTVQKNSESRIILDEGGAENLLMRGDMLIRMAGQRIVRAHGINVTGTDIEEVVRRHG